MTNGHAYYPEMGQAPARRLKTSYVCRGVYMAEWTAPHDEEVQKLFKAQGVRLLKRGPGLPLIGVEERGPAKVKHYRGLISEKGLARLEGYASHELFLD